MREPHFINPTVGNYRPTSVVFFDCETYSTKPLHTREAHRVSVSVLQHWRSFGARGWRMQKECIAHSPAEIAEFITACIRKRSTTYVFAHNVQFDLLVSGLFAELPDSDWKLDSFYFKGLVSIFQWRQDTRKLIALDTSNFFAGKLADLGVTFGVPKMEIDFKTTTPEYLIEYCRNDVRILTAMFFSLLDFLDTHDLGSFKNTLASMSFNAWRHRFLKHKIYVHDDKYVLYLEERAYHGGRVEMLRKGRYDGDTYYRLDVNALYASIMAEKSFPVSLYNHRRSLDVKKLQEKLEKYAVVANVTIETQEPAFPVIYNDALVYPTGVFRTTLSTPELQLLLDCGQILHIHEVAWYQQQPIFAEYMQYLYGLRLAYKELGNAPFDKLAKLLGNSTYGKFAQRTIVTEKHKGEFGEMAKVEYGYDLDSHTPYKIVHIAHEVFEQRPGGFAYHAWPAIAAHVTAWGRVMLYQLIRKAGRENVYHVDTDGLIVNSKGYEALKQHIDPTRLGALKIEEICDWIEVLAPKHYNTPLVNKHKGIRNNAEVLHFDLYRQIQFAGLNTMLIRHSIEEVHVDQIIKSLSFQVRSGLLQPDGQVAPFVLSPQSPAPHLHAE